MAVGLGTVTRYESLGTVTGHSWIGLETASQRSWMGNLVGFPMASTHDGLSAGLLLCG